MSGATLPFYPHPSFKRLQYSDSPKSVELSGGEFNEGKLPTVAVPRSVCETLLPSEVYTAECSVLYADVDRVARQSVGSHA